MNVLLTSCGLETEKIKNVFLDMLCKNPQDAKALFIPTAAIDPDAIEVLPKCLNDLLKCGIKRENISVYDLHKAYDGKVSKAFDIIYICGGNAEYLLDRINEIGFNKKITEFIGDGGTVVGVSAGSIIFANNLENNLGLLPCCLDVHCENPEKPAKIKKDSKERINLGNEQGIVFEDDSIIIFE